MEAQTLETKNEWQQRKWKSRTFLLVVAWMMFIPLGIISQALVPEVKIPIAEIAWAAGIATSLFMAGEKGKTIFMAKNGEI